MMPCESASPSKARMSAELARATSEVHGCTTACPHGVSCSAKSVPRMTAKPATKRPMATDYIRPRACVKPSAGVRGDERLDGLDVGLHHRDALGKLLDALVARRARRVLAERFDDGRVELGG